MIVYLSLKELSKRVASQTQLPEFIVREVLEKAFDTVKTIYDNKLPEAELKIEKLGIIVLNND